MVVFCLVLRALVDVLRRVLQLCSLDLVVCTRCDAWLSMLDALVVRMSLHTFSVTLLARFLTLLVVSVG